MKPSRSPAWVRPNGSAKRTARAACGLSFAVSAPLVLAACEQNSFVAPPPPKVDVGVPVQRAVTRYLEATGNTAPIKSVDLVARVQGVLQSINYQDGAFVKQGTTLFTIEPDTYKLKLEQAEAAEAGAQASLKQTEADYKLQVDLVARQAVSQATLDTSASARDNAQANLQQAQANTKIAAVNYGYTNVVAPFDGIVSAHLVSVGELVGAASPTQLATIVQLDPTGDCNDFGKPGGRPASRQMVCQRSYRSQSRRRTSGPNGEVMNYATSAASRTAASANA